MQNPLKMSLWKHLRLVILSFMMFPWVKHICIWKSLQTIPCDKKSSHLLSANSNSSKSTRLHCFPSLGFHHHGALLPLVAARTGAVRVALRGSMARSWRDQPRGIPRVKVAMDLFGDSPQDGWKTIGKPWENHGKMVVFHGIFHVVYTQPGFIKHGWKIPNKNGGFDTGRSLISMAPFPARHVWFPAGKPHQLVRDIYHKPWRLLPLFQGNGSR